MYLNKWITTSVHTRLDRARSKTLSRVSWVKKRDTQTIDMQDVVVGSVILLHVKGNRIVPTRSILPISQLCIFMTDDKLFHAPQEIYV